VRKLVSGVQMRARFFRCFCELWLPKTDNHILRGLALRNCDSGYYTLYYMSLLSDPVPVHIQSSSKRLGCFAYDDPAGCV
jgi:hypothetical protein